MWKGYSAHAEAPAAGAPGAPAAGAPLSPPSLAAAAAAAEEEDAGDAGDSSGDQAASLRRSFWLPDWNGKRDKKELSLERDRRRRLVLQPGFQRSTDRGSHRKILQSGCLSLSGLSKTSLGKTFSCIFEVRRGTLKISLIPKFASSKKMKRRKGLVDSNRIF